MDYDEAIKYIYNDDINVEIPEDKLEDLYMAVTDDKITSGLELIKELTSCDDNTAGRIWSDLKRDFGTIENNPILRAREKHEQEKRIQEYQYCNNAECPYCHSKNTKKISGLSKAGSAALWGVFAMGKISKQWHCNNCKSDF